VVVVDAVVPYVVSEACCFVCQFEVTEVVELDCLDVGLAIVVVVAKRIVVGLEEVVAREEAVVAVTKALVDLDFDLV
jgi:hypothetical protein